MKQFFFIFFLVFSFRAIAGGTYTSHNASGGDGSFASPFTLQEAADNSTGTVFVLNTGVYTPNTTVDFDVHAGSVALPINFRGVNSTTTSTLEMVTISGTDLGASSNLFFLSLNDQYLLFEYLILTSATLRNVYAINRSFMIMKDCRLTGADEFGFYTVDTFANNQFIRCEIDNNGADGYSTNAGSRGRGSFDTCSIHDNVGDGIQIGTPTNGAYCSTKIIDSLIYGNGGDGVFVGSTTPFDGFFAKNVTVWDNTGDGFDIAVNVGKVFINACINYSNGGYGIKTNTGSVLQFYDINNIGSFGNALGHIDINGGILPGTGNVLENPDFISEIPFDPTPTNINYLFEIVLPGVSGSGGQEWIGAVQPPETAGGGDKWPFRGMRRVGN